MLVLYLKLLFQHLPGGTGGNRETPQKNTFGGGDPNCKC
jgi:hypothetical protein